MHMNSKGQAYYLNSLEVILRGNRPQTIYFFTRDVRDTGIEEIPAGFSIIESTRTGLPLLKRA